VVELEYHPFSAGVGPHRLVIELPGILRNGVIPDIGIRQRTWLDPAMLHITTFQFGELSRPHRPQTGFPCADLKRNCRKL